MRNLIHVWHFGWPHMRQYKGRLFAGILLGLLFGASNLGFVWCSKILTSRLEKEQKIVEVSQEDTWAGSIERLKHSLEHNTNEALDNWLPRVDRKIDGQQVAGLLLLLPLLMATRGFTGYASTYFLAWVSERMVHNLRMQVIDKFHSLSLDYFNRTKLGDLVTRVNGDTAMIQRTMSLVLSDLIKEPATFITVFCGMVVISWQLSLCVLVFLPLCALPVILFGRKVKKAMKGNVQANIDQSSLLIEAAAGIRVVKAFNLEEQQRERFEGHSRRLVIHNIKATKAAELVNPCIETISMVGLAALIAFVFYMGAQLSDLVAMVASVAILFTPVKKLGRVHVFIQRASVGVDRLVSLFSEKPSVQEPTKPVDLKTFENGIELKDVTFSYGEEAVLKNVSLSIPRGHKLGIAGESGSGKSTLINLLLRFYDPTTGSIEIDGKDFRNVRSFDLFEQMALVSQEVIIFDRSVADNIACGRPNATREEIEAAAKDAFAHEFITQLPDGYDTQVGERGVTLSGGQRQRLAIARAFVKDAPILLLDEATAALDSNAEAEVQKAIEHLEENRTVVCIAHRLSTLSNMDRIIVLKQGEIVETGTFDELLAQGGLFATKARRQGIG